MLADMQTLENALPKAERTAKSGDKEAKLRVSAISCCQEHLATDQPLRKLVLPEAEATEIASFGLMTAKPVLYIANVNEDDLLGTVRCRPQRRFADQVGALVAGKAPSWKPNWRNWTSRIERDVGFVGADRARALAVVARETYRTLKLQSYFTAGEKEVLALDHSRGCHGSAGQRRDPYRLRARLYPVRSLFAGGLGKVRQ